MKREKRNCDIPFLIFVGMLLVALVVTAVIMYVEGKDLPVADPSPTATATPTATPSPSEGEKDDNGKETPITPTFSYSLPRTATTSLSPTLAWDLNIGGSGTDVICDALYLDKLYVFGVTSSKDLDMHATDEADLFVATVESDTLSEVMTFGSEAADAFLFAKPCYGVYGTTFIVASQSGNSTVEVFLIPLNTMSELRKTLDLDGKITFKKAIATQDSVIILLNVGNRATLYEIKADGETREIAVGKDGEGVDMQVLGNKAIILAKSAGSNGLTEIITVDLKGKTGANCNIFSDKQRTPLSITPDANGYIVPYKRIVDTKTVYGVMHLSFDLMIDFDHEVTGADFDNITVFADIGAKGKLKGYHIFCTKKSATGYKTTYENVCTHGDLNDFSGELLDTVRPIAYYREMGGAYIIGDVIKEGKSSMYLAVFSSNFALKEEYVFGGEGSDVIIKALTSLDGELLLIGNTTSKSGDISTNFGKSDGVIFCFGK